jgi:hypothetical protein
MPHYHIPDRAATRPRAAAGRQRACRPSSPRVVVELGQIPSRRLLQDSGTAGASAIYQFRFPLTDPKNAAWGGLRSGGRVVLDRRQFLAGAKEDPVELHVVRSPDMLAGLVPVAAAFRAYSALRSMVLNPISLIRLSRSADPGRPAGCGFGLPRCLGVPSAFASRTNSIVPVLGNVTSRLCLAMIRPGTGPRLYS